MAAHLTEFALRSPKRTSRAARFNVNRAFEPFFVKEKAVLNRQSSFNQIFIAYLLLKKNSKGFTCTGHCRKK